jgi:alkylation response protein AidB-like acyl-CoA dehydrogenase
VPQVSGPAIAQSGPSAGQDAKTDFLDWVARCAPRLQAPGRGATWERWATLARLSRGDLALGRLAEGHADAVSILVEAGSQPETAGPYGVWAAGGTKGLTARRSTDGWVIEGQKEFCSGAGMLERALVTADSPDGPRMFDLDVRAAIALAHTWPAVGMAASDSATVSFPGLRASPAQQVGPPGFYTRRIGFWWGAAGVASCWWGGARGLVETVGLKLSPADADEHQLAAFGSAASRLEAMEATLRWAAARVDDPTQDTADARRTARITREVVHDGCREILELVATAGGARPICLDPAQSRRGADLYAYLSQHHGGRDAAALARDLLGSADH